MKRLPCLPAALLLTLLFPALPAGAQRYQWTTFAGSDGGKGAVNGPVAEARFNNPLAMAVAASGTIFVADSDNHCIRRISPDGVVSTFVGNPELSGGTDGTGQTALFGRPTALALAPSGDLFVADEGRNTLRKITRDGVVTTESGNFPNLTGMTFDAAGNLWYVQTSEHVVRRRSPAGVVTNIAGSPGVRGNADGTGSTARFDFPSSIAISSNGDLFVSEILGQTIRRVTPAGVVTTFAGAGGSAGSTDGTGSAARFSAPRGLAFGADGNLYVNDEDNHTLRRITPTRVVTTLAGTAQSVGTADGQGAAARFAGAWGMASLPDGDLLVADRPSHALRRVTLGGAVTTWAGRPQLTGTTNGTGNDARFRQPRAVATDSVGNVYVTDAHAVRKITPAGMVTTLAGNPGTAGSADGTGTTARFTDPIGMAADAAGDLWVADWGNHTIRRVTPGGAVTTVAGRAGEAAFTNGSAANARFFNPMGLCFDAQGNLFIADQNNHAIRRLTVSGTVSTFAGGTGGTGNGTGTGARFSGPSSLTRDAAGIFYVTDGNQVNTIRRMTATGVVTTFAGQPNDGGYADGTGAAARFDAPWGIAFSNGQLYLGDVNNNVIRRLSPAAVVTTVGGKALIGTQIANGIADAARFANPVGVAAGPDGVLYVADNLNARIVRGIPLLPVADPQTLTTAEDVPLPLTLTATDPENAPLTFSILTAPLHGTLEGTPPTLTYRPQQNYAGPDSFTFVASNRDSQSRPATVNLTITPVNDAPVAVAQTLATDEDTALAITLGGTDVESSPLTFAISRGPAHGTLTGTPPSLLYTPAPDYFGPDSFEFTANDGELTSLPATVQLTVRPVNDIPVLLRPLPDVIQTRPGLQNSIDLTLHFRDVETPAALLDYGATPESPAPAGFFSAVIGQASLTLDGLRPGVATVAVSAMDPEGLGVTARFLYRVKHLPAAIGGGIPSQRSILTLPAPVVDLAAWFVDGDGDALSYALMENSNPGAVAAGLSGSQLTLPAVGIGTASIRVRATDSDGGFFDQSFPVIAGTAWPTLESGATLSPDRQTGLLQQSLRITNTTGLVMEGFRITVSGLPDGVRLYQSTAPPGGGSWLDYPARMAPGETVTLVLSWQSAGRRSDFTPTLSAGPLPAPVDRTSPGTGLEITRVLRLPDGAMFLEFPAVAGGWYEIEYSTAGAPWERVLSPIPAGGNRVQWVDRGLPATSAHPATVPSRLYRVRALPPP